MDAPPPISIDLKKDEGLTIEWADGVRSFYPVAHLRRMSPSAEAREQRKEISRNPLTVLKSSGESGPLRALSAELVGNYALRIVFSDGHKTGIYSWRYLREIDPGKATESEE
ncbi:MAG: gamma-butyrobetaine hydroxylase-like domain-containing protein [Phycisphaerales bacterium]